MSLSKGLRRSSYVYGLVFLFLAINQQLNPFTIKLQDDQWSTPQTIPLYHPETWPPVLVADQNRTIHAFSSQWINEDNGEALRVIFYNQWSLEQGWTIPVDIIISPKKEARITDAHLDKNGMLHVVFWGGDNTGADIYYSKAPALIADNARAWSLPIVLGENAGDPEGAVFVEDDQGALYVIYNGRELGNGLYVVNSRDGGETWSDSTPIFFTQSDEPNIAYLQVIKGESGWSHAVWAVFNVSGQGRGIYYAKSMDGSKWSEPLLLADAVDDLGTQTPTIIEYKETLIALYNMPPKITMRRSLDDGKTWDNPFVIFPRHVGVNGSLSLVIDNNNTLHLFFGQRITSSPDIHGLWHSTFVNNRWTEPEALIKGPKVSDAVGNKSFDPNAARAVVSQGNVILVTWRTDPGTKGNGVWFSYKKGFGPELPVKPLSTIISGIETNTNPDMIPNISSYPISPTPTHQILNNTEFENSSITLTPGEVIAISLIVVVLFIVSLLIFILSKRSS